MLTARGCVRVKQCRVVKFDDLLLNINCVKF
jgi:hypothetical protein